MITKTKSRFEITDGINTIFLEVNYKRKRIDILNHVGNKEFCFLEQQYVQQKTWKGKEVAKLIQEAYEFAEKEINAIF